jgi:predicted MFS family arabinose efflux permease
VGSGLVEVMVSPIVEACPTRRKSAYMCLLHSFYCWGHVAVVLFSTLYFSLVGVEKWEYLAYLWALVPLVDMILFCFVPLFSLENEQSVKQPRAYMKNKIFWLIFFMMLCGGAAEQAMSQWASEFAEKGLGVTKALGDLMGPCLFAVLMGTARVVYAKLSTKISLNKFMSASCILCILSYAIAALSDHPLLSLAGCALCGLSVGIMWPGNISAATALLPTSGISMFALLALGGDVGCLIGPALAGTVAEIFGNNLRVSFLVCMLFPALLLLALYLSAKLNKKKQTQQPSEETL